MEQCSCKEKLCFGLFQLVGICFYLYNRSTYNSTLEGKKLIWTLSPYKRFLSLVLSSSLCLFFLLCSHHGSLGYVTHYTNFDLFKNSRKNFQQRYQQTQVVPNTNTQILIKYKQKNIKFAQYEDWGVPHKMSLRGKLCHKHCINDKKYECRLT